MGRGKRNSRKLPCAKLSEGVSKNFEKAPQIQRTLASKNPIGISSRLSYPFIKSTVQLDSGDDENDDEETIEFDFRPRKTFLPTMCLRCSRVCDAEFLCLKCKMVSYCTENHRSEDIAVHRDLCGILKKSGSTIGKKHHGSPEDYRSSRVEVMKKAEVTLGRHLELWERETILYPRVCTQCHHRDDSEAYNLLQCCPDCKVVFRCQEHRFDGPHSEWCLQYQIFRKILLAQAMHGNAEPRIPNVHFTEGPRLSRSNFDDVMSKIDNNSGYIREMDFYNYATLSHLASIPLTTLYAFQESQRDWKNVESLSVHLIGAEFQYEGINLRVWEKLFLHFLPNLKNLLLVVTGSELFLPEVPGDLLSKVQLCQRCKSTGKRIDVSFAPETLYHDYCSSSMYRKPDFICLFNPGLYRTTGFNGEDTWPKTIDELGKSNAPILVTAYTEREIPMDIERINSLCEMEVVLQPKRNPFASLKPDRNFVSDESVPLIYKNYFLSVVKAVR